MNTTKVKLRQKAISKGRKSLYLDFYPAIKNPSTGKATRREFLGLYIIAKAKGAIDKQHNVQTLALGENIRAKRQIEIQKGEYGLSGNPNEEMDFLKFFSELMRSKFDSDGNYGNWNATKKHLKSFRPDGIKMKDITIEFLEEFISYLNSKTKIKQNSKVSYYRKLSAAIKQAYNKNYINSNPTKLVKAPKEESTKREFLTLEELQKVAKHECEIPSYKQAFLFSALTGLRFSDIEKLLIKDIKGSKKKGYYIRYKQQKTKTEETLPIPKSAIDLIDLNGPANRRLIEDLHYSAYHNSKLQDWIDKAEIGKKITFHCARHTFATLQLTMGTDIYTVSKLLGHSDLKTTQVYANIIDKKKEEASKKLNNISL